MKKLLFAIISIFFTSLSFIFAQEKLPRRDSKEWNDLTVAQRWQAVNLDEEQLTKMTTYSLIEHCVNFSFMWDIFNYETYGIGLNVVIEQHNGLRELLNRKDSGEQILNYYNKIDLKKVTEINEPVKRGEFVAKIFFLELYLSHFNIIKQFEGNEIDLIKSILLSHEKCLQINSEHDEELYSDYSLRTKALLIGCALEKLKGIKMVELELERLDVTKISNTKYMQLIEVAKKL